jgi:hypothetical protein
MAQLGRVCRANTAGSDRPKGSAVAAGGSYDDVQRSGGYGGDDAREGAEDAGAYEELWRRVVRAAAAHYAPLKALLEGSQLRTLPGNRAGFRIEFRNQYQVNTLLGIDVYPPYLRGLLADALNEQEAPLRERVAEGTLPSGAVAAPWTAETLLLEFVVVEKKEP